MAAIDYIHHPPPSGAFPALVPVAPLHCDGSPGIATVANGFVPAGGTCVLLTHPIAMRSAVVPRPEFSS